jgi:Tol biopolymer transport system component
MLVFVGDTNGESRLWVRRLDSPDARPLPGTERAYFPFWSPDSKTVAFFTTAPPEIKRIAIAGGAPVAITKAQPNYSGGAWGNDDTLILGDRGGAQLLKVSATGGEPKPLGDGIQGRYPHFLPDGNRFVYLAPAESGSLMPSYSDGVLMLHSLEGKGPPKTLGKGGSWPQFSRDHLLWFSGGRVIAQRFDANAAALTGDPYPVARVAHRVFLAGMLATFSVDRSGRAVYPDMEHAREKLVWRSRAGRVLRESAGADDFSSPNISADGTRLAVARRDFDNTDIWREELGDLSTSRVTFEPGVEDHPVWSPQGSDLLYTKKSPVRSNLYRLADGDSRRLTTSPFDQQVVDWSSDGHHYLYTQIRRSSEIMVAI